MKSNCNSTELNYDTQLVSARKWIDVGEKHTSGWGMCDVEYVGGESSTFVWGFSLLRIFFFMCAWPEMKKEKRSRIHGFWVTADAVTLSKWTRNVFIMEGVSKFTKTRS